MRYLAVSEAGSGLTARISHKVRSMTCLKRSTRNIVGRSTPGAVSWLIIWGCGWFTNYFMSCFSGMLSMKFSTY